jgi:hypothetical protein
VETARFFAKVVRSARATNSMAGGQLRRRRTGLELLSPLPHTSSKASDLDVMMNPKNNVILQIQSWLTQALALQMALLGQDEHPLC